MYVCNVDSAEYKRHILFRDYLRSHCEDAKSYSVLKLELAKRFSNDREAYMNAKSDFVIEILQRAEVDVQQVRLGRSNS
ncbi:GrpB family protein [Cohnella sp. GCM10012308]|uniref:GrpB family protein n=1 Tax=Cohnella sp. GCM10012308 TaxID=3317329 RepID=UPI00360A6287